MDRAPLVAITAQAGTERFHKESHQYLDLISLYRPAVKWNAQLVRPQVIPEAVRKAFKVAQTEKPGATHLYLPEDVAEAEAPSGFEPLIPQQPFPTEPSEQQIERAAKIISEARDPIVLAGNGIARGRASEALRGFAETLGIPVVETFMGKGSLPDTHPFCLGTVGLQEHDYVSCGLDRADVVICVGYDLVEYAPARWNPRQDKHIVHIDPSPAEVDAAYQVAVGVQGGIAESLLRIAKRAPVRGEPGAVRAKTNFVALIFEDSGYGVIKWKQLKRYGRPAFVNFGNPDFAALAESFGCRGYKVTAAQELQPILEEAFRQPVPAVVACPVDYGENLRLTEKLGAWVCP